MFRTWGSAGRCGVALALISAAALCAQTLEFNRDIQPILADKCYHCHGPDTVAKKVPRRSHGTVPFDCGALARR